MTIKKEQKIKNLTWNYFWEAKAKEIAWVFVVVMVLLLIPLATGMLNCALNPDRVFDPNDYNSKNPSCDDFWTLYELGLYQTFILAFAVGGLYLLYLFIRFNWKSARDKAHEEVLGEDYYGI